MRYLDLNILTVQHLIGSWAVLEKPGGAAADTSIFAACSQLDFAMGGTFQVTNGGTQTGRWEMFKEEEIIYNPQLNFTIGTDEEVLNAIITRFREDQEDDGKGTITETQTMTIYFNSGLELVLGRSVN